MQASNAKATLVAVILTKDEAAHIHACVTGLRAWLDTVIVWDSGSSDETQALARAAGALVVERAFDNYSAQRQAVLDTIQAEWILFVDADERVTPAFMEEVQRLISAGQANGYWIPRRNLIVGHEVRYGGYYPDYQLRLLRRSAAHYDVTRAVHEFAVIDGAVGYMEQPFIHYNYANWSQFHAKQHRYAAYEAQILANRGIRPRPHNFVLQPAREINRRALRLSGWRDGWIGWWLALWFGWYYGFMPYWLLLTKQVR